MKVAGVTFIRNAIQFAYPIKEAIRSILPLCDELVIAVGKSEDETLAHIQSIESPKIRIIQTVWDDSLREGGQVLAVETNKALDAVSQDVDWCFYIQGDEVLHEQYIPSIKKAMQQHLHTPQVEGLLFNYLHFWGNFDYVADSRKWYRKEIRIIRNDPQIRSYKDAQGFRKNGQKLSVKAIDAYMYHYGWVRPPEKQLKKRRSSNRFWHDDEWIDQHIPDVGEYDYSQIDSIKKFEGSHPAVMQARIDTINWEFSPPTPQLSLKERLSRWIENLTGYRIGEYKNYKLLK